MIPRYQNKIKCYFANFGRGGETLPAKSKSASLRSQDFHVQLFLYVWFRVAKISSLPDTFCEVSMADVLSLPHC